MKQKKQKVKESSSERESTAKEESIPVPKGPYTTRAALEYVCKGISGMSTVSAIEEERWIPTLITSFNRATGIGGLPQRRLLAIHGKNQTGKSVLAALLAESARKFGHIPIIYEAEFSAESRWMNRLVCGDETGFLMPENLDEVIESIQKNLENLKKGKKGNFIPEDKGCCFVIDTLTKLIPEEQFNQLIEKGIEKSYSTQAYWVSMWSKIIVPQIYRSNSTLIIVLQERQNVGASKFQKQRKVTLGEALLYDVSIRIECTHSAPVKRGETIIGSQFFYSLEKNKSDGFTAQEGSFFTSTGAGDTPAGIDLAREAIEEGKFRGILKTVKRDKVDHVLCEYEGKELFCIPGGMEDLREKMNREGEFFQQFVDSLNSQAKRLK